MTKLYWCYPAKNKIFRREIHSNPFHMQQNWVIWYGMITYRIASLITTFSNLDCKADKHFLAKGKSSCDICMFETMTIWNEYFSHIVRWNDNHTGWCSHTCGHNSDGSAGNRPRRLTDTKDMLVNLLGVLEQDARDELGLVRGSSVRL